MMTLGQRIQELRKSRDLSQEALGEILGVSRQAVSRWEMDGAVPEVDKLLQMAKLFGLSLDDLLRVEEPVPTEEGTAEASGPEEAAGAQRRGRTGMGLPVLVLLVLVLGLAALTVSFAQRTGTLQDELAQMEGRLDELEQKLEESSAGLDPSAPLVSDFEFSVEGGQLKVDLVPFQQPEGLEVEFALSSGGKTPLLVTGTADGKGHYAASLPLDGWASGLTVSAVLSDGTRRYTQRLVYISDMDDSGYSWRTLWEEQG